MQNPIEISTVLKELHNISGFRISIHDTDFNEIEGYPKAQSPFCRLMKDNEKTKTFCHENDTKAFCRVQETGEVYLYQCSFGLYEAAAPLYSFGKLTGYLMMGQTLDTFQSGPATVLSTAAPYFPATQKQNLEEAIKDIHVRAKENILSCLSIMAICAEYITLTNRLNNAKRDLPQEVKNYLDRNYSEKISINALCERFYCSRATLMSVFKKSNGMTVNGYLTRVRVNNATSLLTMTNKSIYEIAELCGFTDQNYFSKVFVKIKGRTPTEFRADA